ncbi:MAG: hypothetical protein AABY64_00020 [Bdellovibrionota bacterium]
MKNFFSRFIIICCFLVNGKSMAATKWTNCLMPSSQSQAIAEVFWKSDANGGSGPTYDMPSGHTLSNAGSVCAEKKINSLSEWTSQLKSGINPAKSVTTFKLVKSASEFNSFLETVGTSVSDVDALESAVTAFLNSKSSIIVGSSKNQAVILFASHEGKQEYARFLQLDKK